ncbi:hypothetical protein [Phenylobacterium immobile]|uniref:hypothetical protein n=1 Tax=Phenylobacterium immobile TaxID=21 RepID=UPI00159ED3F4|nr:hypothetical protein [Phenylobacterium immobile]
MSVQTRLETEGSTAALHMRFAGGLEKHYPVDPTTARRVRAALANGQQGFLAFDAADVAAVINCANLAWTQVIFDPDPIIDDGGHGAAEAVLDFRLKLYFDGEAEAQAFDVEPDKVEISQEAGEGGAEVQWLLSLLEASGDHQDVMSFASADGEVIFNLSRLCLIEAPMVTVRPSKLATAIEDHVVAIRPI